MAKFESPFFIALVFLWLSLCGKYGSHQCTKEIIIGGGNQTEDLTEIDTNIVPTCFTCFDSSNRPVLTPTFRVDGLQIILNENVYQLWNGLIVNNFDSFSPQLQDGQNYQITCSQDLFRNVYIVPLCEKEVLIGGSAMISTVAMVNTLLYTCFMCLDSRDTPAIAPNFSINNIPIPLKAGVRQSRHTLFVTDFANLPMLMDGVRNQFECIDAYSTYFSRTVTTLNPIQPIFLRAIADFYVEGDIVQAICINRNVRPFLGRTFWVDPMNMIIGNGGVIEFIAARNHRGLYSCRVNLTDPMVLAIVPARSFTLVVHES